MFRKKIVRFKNIYNFGVDYVLQDLYLLFINQINI